MFINKIKNCIQKKIPILIPYTILIKKFSIRFLENKRTLLFELKQLYIHKKINNFNSDNLKFKDIIEITFKECYLLLKNCNLIYLTETSTGCHRFIILEQDVNLLYKGILTILETGYIIEFTNKNGKKTLTNKKILIKRMIKNFSIIRIYKVYKNSKGIEEFGSEIAFEIECWYEKNGYYITYSKNNIQNRLSNEAIKDVTVVKLFHYKVKQLSQMTLYDKFNQLSQVKSIDIVYTWVDGSDSNWSKKKNTYQNDNTNGLHTSALSASRFNSWDELKYSLRSLEKYFLGYRKIFIVVDDQKPEWLKESKNLIIVDHKDLFPDTSVLPVFNSHAIETVLHRIEGLSEHYLYINDDIFFSKGTAINLFFPKKGNVSIFPSTKTYIPFDKPNKNLLPVDTASINTRRLLVEKNIGFALFKFKHTPFPQLKSTLYKIEELFNNEVLRTRKNRFRHPSDISMTSSLFNNYSYLKDIAVKNEVEYSYIDLSLKNKFIKLKKIITTLSYKRPTVFCINDVDSSRIDKKEEKEIINIMESFFPASSEFEYS